MSSTPHTQRDAQPNDYLDGPRLLADVGGTNARFALERAPGQIDTIIVLRCADYEEFADACEAYLTQAGNPPVRHAAIDMPRTAASIASGASDGRPAIRSAVRTASGKL